MRRWASSSLEAVIPVVDRLSVGTGSMHPASSSRDAAVWEMKTVPPTRQEMFPKKESTSARSTVYRPTSRISARTSSGSSRGPAREEGPRLRVERDERGRAGRPAADQEFRERERRDGGEHPEARQSRQDAGGQ